MHTLYSKYKLYKVHICVIKLDLKLKYSKIEQVVVGWLRPMSVRMEANAEADVGKRGSYGLYLILKILK